MSKPLSQIIVAVAFACSGEVLAWTAVACGEERELIRCTLSNLLDLGHVASFSIRSGVSATVNDIVDELRSRIGCQTVDACSASPVPCNDAPPAFLVSVWPFDHLVGDAPAATARLLGLDLELIATPSSDDELGAHLPGRDGLWLVHASPMF